MKYWPIWVLLALALVAPQLMQDNPTDEQQALQECIKEVETNCKGLYNYAISLEEENARLNRLYRECRN